MFIAFFIAIIKDKIVLRIYLAGKDISTVEVFPMHLHTIIAVLEHCIVNNGHFRATKKVCAHLETQTFITAYRKISNLMEKPLNTFLNER